MHEGELTKLAQESRLARLDSDTPDRSISNALSTNSRYFERVARGTYRLTNESVRSFHDVQQAIEQLESEEHWERLSRERFKKELDALHSRIKLLEGRLSRISELCSLDAI